MQTPHQAKKLHTHTHTHTPKQWGQMDLTVENVLSLNKKYILKTTSKPTDGEDTAEEGSSYGASAMCFQTIQALQSG